MPPSDSGLRTSARRSTDTGGKRSPPLWGFSPVPLATAAISIADLVPSKKELYILALKAPGSHLLRCEAVVLEDGIRSRIGVSLQVLGTLACGSHFESTGAGPVNQLADQGRLISVRHAVYHTPPAGPACSGSVQPRHPPRLLRAPDVALNRTRTVHVVWPLPDFP